MDPKFPIKFRRFVLGCRSAGGARHGDLLQSTERQHHNYLMCSTVLDRPLLRTLNHRVRINGLDGTEKTFGSAERRNFYTRTEHISNQEIFESLTIENLDAPLKFPRNGGLITFLPSSFVFIYSTIM